MKPRGPLMIEHRLIEKMLVIAGKELEKIGINKIVDPVFVDTIVDFIRMYADRTHHGKEEDILFRELESKGMSNDDARVMKELISEHKEARRTVKELIEAKDDYIEGRTESVDVIIEKLSFLVEFYPEHILKEDKVFFPNTEKYFTEDELNEMLVEFWEFDRKMIHEKYNRLYELLSENYK